MGVGLRNIRNIENFHNLKSDNSRPDNSTVDSKISPGNAWGLKHLLNPLPLK